MTKDSLASMWWWAPSQGLYMGSWCARSSCRRNWGPACTVMAATRVGSYLLQSRLYIIYSFLILKISLQSTWRLGRSSRNAMKRWTITFPLWGIWIERCGLNQAVRSWEWSWRDASNGQLWGRAGKVIDKLKQGGNGRCEAEKGPKRDRPVRIESIHTGSSSSAIEESVQAWDWGSCHSQGCFVRSKRLSCPSLPILGCRETLSSRPACILKGTLPHTPPSPLTGATLSKDPPLATGYMLHRTHAVVPC